MYKRSFFLRLSDGYDDETAEIYGKFMIPLHNRK